MRLADIGQLQYAATLAASERWEDAIDVLAEFLERHPDNLSALELMLQVASELQDPLTTWISAWKLVQLSPDDRQAYYALAAASMANALPFCALHYAQQYLERWPDGAEAADVADLKATVTPVCNKIQQGDPVAAGKSIADLALLDQAHLLVSQRFYEEGRHVCQQAIERLPDLPAPLNNLGMTYAMEGNLKEALRIARQTVERFPDNTHARCNLIQFLVRTGARAEAQALAASLREGKAYRYDDWLKLIETFTYLGEDQTVVQVYERFRESLGKDDIMPPMTKHLVAVALARTGDEKRARKLWKEALAEDDSLQIAQDNLDDLKKPPGKRSGAWPYHLGQWVPVAWIESLANVAEARNETMLKRRLERFVRETPEILAVAPILLERGDPYGRQFVLHLASIIPIPGLREFVVSSHGSDDDRLQASQYAVEHGMLPRGKPLPMYRDGKPQELLLLNYEIHDEPQRSDLPKAARRLLEQSIAATRQANYEEALRLAQEGLKIAPDAPPLMNGVAAALGGLGRRDEMKAMIRRMAELHPDYLFARCAMVRLCIDEGRLDEAQQWLDPLLERPRFHISEFNAVCMAHIELLEARGLRDSARSWLTMWERSDPDAPQLPVYRQRLKRK